LISYGADVHASNEQGINMLHVAAQSNAVYALGFFLRNSAFTVGTRDKSECTALHWACQCLATEAVRYLIAWRGEIHSKDEK